jgi:hypothetical protein
MLRFDCSMLGSVSKPLPCAAPHKLRAIAMLKNCRICALL